MTVTLTQETPHRSIFLINLCSLYSIILCTIKQASFQKSNRACSNNDLDIFLILKSVRPGNSPLTFLTLPISLLVNSVVVKVAGFIVMRLKSSFYLENKYISGDHLFMTTESLATL